jgi:hypothetical protein
VTEDYAYFVYFILRNIVYYTWLSDSLVHTIKGAKLISWRGLSCVPASVQCC